MKSLSIILNILLLTIVQFGFAKSEIPRNKKVTPPLSIEQFQLHQNYPEYLQPNPDEREFPFDDLLDRERNYTLPQEERDRSVYYGVVYRSIDGGQNWEAITPQTSEWENNYLYDIEIDAHGDILVVGNNGLYKTDPDYINWINYGYMWGGVCL